MRNLIFSSILSSALLVSAPVQAQFYQPSYSSYDQHGDGLDQTLCKVEEVTRIIGNVAEALRDRGYNNFNGGYNNCNYYRNDYRQDQYYRRQQYYPVPPQYYPQTSPGQYFVPSSNYGPYHWPSPQSSLPGISPQSRLPVCIITSSGRAIC